MVSGSLVIYNASIGSYSDTIDSFFNNECASTLVVVDNSKISSQRRALEERYSEQFSLGKIRYLSLPNNPGYGTAHNYAYKSLARKEEYHVIMNPDVSFGRTVLGDLSKIADVDQSIGMIMPQVRYPDGKMQYLCKLLPTPADLFIRRFLPEGRLKRWQTNKYELRYSGYDKLMDVPYLSGCFMFLRSSVFEAEGFDERYFMYPEDIDLTRRIHRRYRTLYYPGTYVTHNHEKASYKSPQMLWIHFKNMVLYFNKWGWFKDDERKAFNDRLIHEIDAARGGENKNDQSKAKETLRK